MRDRVEQLQVEEIYPREAQIEQIRDEAEEYDEPWQIPDDLERRYVELKEEIKRLRGEADTLEHYADEWGDDVFVIRELSAGGVGMIRDDVAEASDINLRGDGTPKGGYARTRTLEVAVKDSPSEAPAPENLADIVADWLFDCVDEFNATGEVDLGNSSLRAEIMRSES